MRRFVPQLFAQLFCIVTIFIAVTNSHAQTARARSQELIQNRVWTRTDVHRDFTPEQITQQKLAELSIRNDFRKLQLINNQLMSRVFQPLPDEKQISKKEIRSQLGEIKKLAVRLRYFLAIPKVEQAEPAKALALDSGLLLLDNFVMSFVHNPFFQQPGVYDHEQATRAGEDLSEVLRLAEVLRNFAKDH